MSALCLRHALRSVCRLVASHLGTAAASSAEQVNGRPPTMGTAFLLTRVQKRVVLAETREQGVRPMTSTLAEPMTSTFATALRRSARLEELIREDAGPFRILTGDRPTG